MRFLLVGAGAVGQVYGRHLRLGGSEVGFFVRPKYAEAARKGFDLYPLPRRRAVHFSDFSVHTSWDEVARERWDGVILCISSTGLRGDWVEEMSRTIGDATVVTLQPGPEDYTYLARWIPPERLVCGIIGIVSYSAPLPGESLPPGTAYWLPPLSETPFSESRARSIVDAFRRGGIRSRLVSDVRPILAFGAAFLNLHIAALELTRWKLDGLRGPLLRLAARAVREAVTISARDLGVGEPPWPSLLLTIPRRWAIHVAPHVVPFDLETYLRVHFTKVGDQTRLMVRTYLERADRFAIPAPALREIHRRLS